MAEQSSDGAHAFAAAHRGDVMALPDLLHGRPRAGSVRDRRPVYVDLLPPCNAGCPGRGEYPGLACPCPGRRPRAGLASADRRQSLRQHPRSGLL